MCPRFICAMHATLSSNNVVKLSLIEESLHDPRIIGSSILAICIHDLLHELQGFLNDLMTWPPLFA